MSQNIYDKPEFFEGYSKLGRSVEGLAGAAEWPALRAMLPELKGKAVLDLGCGFGWVCRWARERGAAEVLGMDLSERMLERARATTVDPAIAYTRADMEELTLPGGAFVFSVEHPLYTAPLAPGWTTDAAGRKTWPVDGYLAEGPRRTDWIANGVIKQHRTIATYLNLLLGLGFVLVHVDEWGPTAEQIAARPALADERQRPPFLLVSARRPD